MSTDGILLSVVTFFPLVGAIAIALHCGPVTLLQVNDPLHGDQGSMLATGETVHAALQLREHAAACGWQIACSAQLVEGLSGAITTGRTATVSGTDGATAVAAVELLSLA